MIPQEQPAERTPASAANGDETAAEPPAPPEETPPIVADGVVHSLDSRKITLDRIGGWIFTGTVALINLVVIVIVLLTAPLPGWMQILLVPAWVVLTAGLGWISQVWPPVEHRHASYKVDRQGIEIRRGVVWRKAIHVPRSRVQHTDVSQGPLERRFGLGTLVVYTAGTDHARVDLGGLDHGTALLIRDHLLPREDGDAV